MVDVALEHQVLQVRVRRDERERRRALVDLAALDADSTVLDHVEAAEAGRSRARVERRDEVRQVHRHAVDRDGQARVESPRVNSTGSLAVTRVKV